MAESVNVKNIGLRGVVVADTAVSFIDGEKGILIYRGYRIEDLAGSTSFPEIVHLLLVGHLPNEKELATIQADLAEAGELPGFIVDSMRHIPTSATPMDVLQGMVPMLAAADPELEDESREANLRMAVRLTARVPPVAAAWHRIRQGLDPLPQDPELGHSGNFLWQMSGKKPDPQMAKDFDTCLVLHADHTFNASTFAVREVISTRAHIYAGISAGVGALSGSLHGGANARVMGMLLGLENEPDVPGWVRGQLEQGNRIMGIGHAVYKTMDPRATILREMGGRLGELTGDAKWYKMLAQIEATAMEELSKRGKGELRPNVDFFSAPVYHVMGIPRDMMTPIFAISRVSGWTAHAVEEKFGDVQGKPALYRPKAEYVGNYCGLIGCEFEPMDKRS
jgi:citrate synthase